MKMSSRLAAERKYVEESLGDSVICEKCKCTLSTYAVSCTAGLSELCPGFESVENAKIEFGRCLEQGGRLDAAAGKGTEE